MNRKQIFPLLTAVAVAAVAFGIWSTYRAHQHYLQTLTWTIAHDFVTTTNSPHLTNLDPALHDALARFLSKFAHVEKVLLGDDPHPPGDGKLDWELSVPINASPRPLPADCRIYLINQDQQRIVLRLRQDDVTNLAWVGFRRTLEPERREAH